MKRLLKGSLLIRKTFKYFYKNEVFLILRYYMNGRSYDLNILIKFRLYVMYTHLVDHCTQILLLSRKILEYPK